MKGNSFLLLTWPTDILLSSRASHPHRLPAPQGATLFAFTSRALQVIGFIETMSPQYVFVQGWRPPKWVKDRSNGRDSCFPSFLTSGAHTHTHPPQIPKRQSGTVPPPKLPVPTPRECLRNICSRSQTSLACEGTFVHMIIFCLTPPSTPVHLAQVWAAQPCLTLCDPVDCSPPGSSVRGILQARILERVAVPFSSAPSRCSVNVEWTAQFPLVCRPGDLGRRHP